VRETLVMLARGVLMNSRGPGSSQVHCSAARIQSHKTYLAKERIWLIYQQMPTPMPMLLLMLILMQGLSLISRCFGR